MDKWIIEIYGDWGLGIGDWGLGVWGGGPTPNPQTPTPHPHTPLNNFKQKKFIKFFLNYFIKNIINN